MSTYAWPTSLIPQRMAIRYVGNNRVFRSPLNGQIQTAARPGSRLAFDIVFEVMSQDQRSELQGFIAKLDGQANYFTMPFYGHVNRGAGGGTPQVNGASQTGTSINSKLWPANTLVLRRGDTVTIGNELKVITDDVTSDGSGNAALPVRPGQRVAAAANSAITFTDAPGLFMLDGPETAVQSFSNPDIRLGSASLAIVEVVAQP